MDKNGKVNVPDVCLDCLGLIFVTFKPPASRSRAYCDCNPIRAFETFDISKETISKTSRSWMFWYRRGCNWLGAIKGMALWSRGFSRGPLFFAQVTFFIEWPVLKASGPETWPKPETAHEKPLAPRVSEAWDAFRYTGPTGERPLELERVRTKSSTELIVG